MKKLFFLLFMTISVTWAQKNLNQKIVSDFITAAQLEKSLNEFKTSFWNDFSQSYFDLFDSAGVEAKFDSSFSKAVLDSITNSIVVNNYNETAFRTYIAWIESPLGKKFTRLDTAYALQEHKNLIAATALKIYKKQLTGRTVKYIEQMVETINLSDYMLELAVSVSDKIFNELSVKFTKSQVESYKKLRTQMKKRMEEIRPLAKSILMANMYYSYKDLRYSEFDEILNFYNSVSGKLYISISKKITDTVVKKCLTDFLKSVAKNSVTE